jgi:hypothetical protein
LQGGESQSWCLWSAGLLHWSCQTQHLDQTRGVGNHPPWQISENLSSRCQERYENSVNVAFQKLMLVHHQVLLKGQLSLEPLLNRIQAKKILHGSSMAWRLSRSSKSWVSLGIIYLTACCHDQG